MSYLMYLRKSRADKEAEARGEGETLARHEQLLTELAVKMGLLVGAIYKELVSGETISARPKMQQTLLEVMQGMWEGVLVMEVERLARGDTKDQGTVAEAFKFSNTKIITPMKTYDPSDEFDEEYFEFNLFMSRREYKTINRRIQRGRIAAFRDGWYIAGTAPYGYKKVKQKGDKGYTLEIVPKEAKIVEYIYELYTAGELQEDGSHAPFGSYQIRDRLNELNIPSRTGGIWSASSIIDILSNPIYIGYQRWQWRKVMKQMIHGTIIETRPKDENCEKVKGRFQAIINEDKYNLVQNIKAGKPLPNITNTTLQNPLSGLVYCSKCGTMMTRQPSNTKLRYAVLRCPNSSCNNISAPLSLIEEMAIEGLNEWIPEYELNWPEEPEKESSTTLSVLENSIHSLEDKYHQTVKQLNKTYDLLEQNVYSINTFEERHKTLENQEKELLKELEHLKKERNCTINRKQARCDFIPSVKHLVEVYWKIDDIRLRNSMLRNVLDHIDYLKTERNKKGAGNTANFTLKFYPRLPESKTGHPAVRPHHCRSRC
ncbi:recombinase family protein [Clostridium sp. E02]|uniref:recombinase family protein n=1 Tax=Clostridium sp. E02 TaxID=2487134 RepID=UPI0013DE6EC8|nr:recombinase family protein [Clostridium sp. E02]